jgi:hypothetical protein
LEIAIVLPGMVFYVGASFCSFISGKTRIFQKFFWYLPPSVIEDLYDISPFYVRKPFLKFSILEHDVRWRVSISVTESQQRRVFTKKLKFYMLKPKKIRRIF